MNLNIHDVDNYGCNALMAASYNGYLDIVQYLVIDMNMSVDEEVLDWLKGNNNIKKIHYKVLDIIEKRELYQKLNNSFSDTKKHIYLKL